MQTGEKRTRYQREHDLAQLAGLYLRGKLQSEMAAALKVSQRRSPSPKQRATARRAKVS